MSKRRFLITQWFDPEPVFKGLLLSKKLVCSVFVREVVTGFTNYPVGELYGGYR